MNRDEVDAFLAASDDVITDWKASVDAGTWAADGSHEQDTSGVSYYEDLPSQAPSVQELLGMLSDSPLLGMVADRAMPGLHEPGECNDCDAVRTWRAGLPGPVPASLISNPTPALVPTRLPDPSSDAPLFMGWGLHESGCTECDMLQGIVDAGSGRTTTVARLLVRPAVVVDAIELELRVRRGNQVYSSRTMLDDQLLHQMPEEAMSQTLEALIEELRTSELDPSIILWLHAMLGRAHRPYYNTSASLVQRYLRQGVKMPELSDLAPTRATPIFSVSAHLYALAQPGVDLQAQLRLGDFAGIRAWLDTQPGIELRPLDVRVATMSMDQVRTLMQTLGSQDAPDVDAIIRQIVDQG